MLFDRIRSVLGLPPDEEDDPAADLNRVGERETVSDRIDHDAWSRQLPDDWSIRFDIEPSVDGSLEEVGIVDHPGVDWIVVVAPTSERTVTVNRRYPSGEESRLFSASTPETALARLTDRLPTPSPPEESTQSDTARRDPDRRNPSRTTNAPGTDHNSRHPDRDHDGARAD